MVHLSDRREWMVAYDKGLLATYTDEQLNQDYSKDYLKLQTEVGGLIDNSRVDDTVAELMWHKSAGRNQRPKPVGVLVGKLDMPMFEDPKTHVYMSFYVHVEAFGKPAATRVGGTRSAATLRTAKKDEDAWHRRQEYHTFRRFDIVTHVEPEAGRVGGRACCF